MSKSTKVAFKIKGMSCSGCASTVTRFLKNQNATKVHVDFVTGDTSFYLSHSNDDEKDNTLKKINKGIHSLGYTVVSQTEDKLAENEKKFSLSPLEIKFYTSLVFTLPLFSSMMLPFSLLHNSYVQLLLCIPVTCIGIAHFGRSAIASLALGVPNMDVLILIGSTTAFIYSLTGTIYNLGENFCFYETSATIVTLVLLGNVIEHLTIRKTTSSIEALTRAQSTNARRIIIENNKEIIKEVDYNSIFPGDMLLVNTGDKIPVDGVVDAGNGSTDESMLTGESNPVDKNKGDKVIGGTILLNGSIKVKAEKVGKETMLAQIIDLVKNAQASKLAIQNLGDKASAVFVPVVIIIALLTFCISFWFSGVVFQSALINSIAVMVIACPCAMGLATPTAVSVGIGRAAANGILVKGGRTLEEFSRTRNIVFDKTGILTTGKFKIKQLTCIKNTPEEKVKNIIFNLEQHSSHPIAKSMVAACKEPYNEKINLTSFKEEKGIGIYANDDRGNSYQIGSHQITDKPANDSSHNIYLLMNNEIIATLNIEDEIKDDAAELINGLKSKGINIILLSGDRKDKCEKIASTLGIKEVYSEMLPHQKMEIIEKLVKQNTTAMVGDGINDAPALAKASIGISLSDSTDVAIQAAQIILLKGNLNNLLKTLALSQHTLITIKQNLFWAFFYNVVAIPIAALGMLNPMVAALTMAFSDVVVIGNSLRFKTKKIL